MHRSKILIIAPFCPEIPLRGYEKLLLHHLPDLVKSYDVDLVTLDISGDYRQLYYQEGIVNQISVPSGLWARVIGLVVCVAKGLPIQCAQFCSPYFFWAVKKMVASKDYDRVICYMARTFAAVPVELHQKTLVFAIDPLLVSYRLSARVSSLMLRFAYRLEGFLIGRFEKFIIKSVKSFALISPYDVRRYLRLFKPLVDIDLIHYGSDRANSNTPLIDRDQRMLIVSGSGFYAPNILALKYLLEEVWPEVSKLGYYRLRIIGSGIDPYVFQLAAKFPDIEVVGFVESVYEHLSKAFASFCLVDLDVGIQTKLLESMSCGTPAICSRASGRGVGAQDGREVLIANSPLEIVAALETLRTRPQFWGLISKNAYEFIDKRYRWSHSSDDLLGILKR